ncbi:MAG: caspase family protein [Bacteroidota bacterium]
MFSRINSVFLFILMLITANAVSQSVETVIQAGHYAAVTAVCTSYDGQFIATGSSDKTIILWRASDGKQIRSFRGSPDDISYVEFNRQGNAILSFSGDGTVMLWDITSGKEIKRIMLTDDRFTCASFNPEGNGIVTGSRKSGVSTWDINTGEKISDYAAVPQNLLSAGGFNYGEAGTVAFSNDGKFIIAGVGDNTAILWDAKTGDEIRKYKKTRTSCTSCIAEAVITSDNKYILTGSTDSIKMFDRSTGSLVREFYGRGGSLESLKISIDNHFVTAIDYGVARVWDINTGKILCQAGDYSKNKTLSVIISPDGRNLITASEKRFSEVWDIKSGDKIMTLEGYLNQVDERILADSYIYWAALVNEARLSPDERFIAVGRTGNNAKLIDFKTGRVFATLKGHKSMVISLCFSPDGKYLATGGLDGKAIVWNVETGDSVRVIRFRDEKLAIFSVDISADGKMLATADWGGYVYIWDIETGKMIRGVSPHERMGVYQVKFSASGVYFISAGLDRKLKLTEIDTGEEIRVFTGHTNLVNSINLSPDGSRIITSGWDGTVRVWDFYSGLQVLKIKAHEGGAYSAKIDPSGKYIVSGGDDFLVRQWDAATGKMISELAGHRGGVGDVNVTADLQHIISGSRDGSVRIWNLPEKREIVSLIFLNENDWFIRNLRGYFDASEGAFSSISFVKGTEIYSVSQFFNEFYRPGLYNEAFGGNAAVYRQNIMQTIEKSPPPGIEILLPDDGSAIESPIVTLMVKVTNNGGGVKEFKVMHNGKRQTTDASDLQRMTKPGQYTTKNLDINLIPGENIISVSAFSIEGIESESKDIRLIYKGLQKSSDCYVLSIGINIYQNENLTLTYARPDAQAFASFLDSKGEKLFNRIHSITLFDENATRARILAAIDEISRTMKKEDVFVFFYAGHGSTEEGVFYFITSEITGLYQQEKLQNALRVNELQEKFKLLPALKQVVFVDACHSGSSVETLAMRGASEEKALAQLSRSSGVHVMASSESEQQSAEIKSLGHGVFTYVLLEALKGKADGAPADSKITIYEIKSYIDDQVPEVSFNLIRHKQFPSTFSMGHDFPLVME